MKIAVYTIALNEEQFVQRWYDSCKEADYLFIADTGSTDKTVELAKSLGINVTTISVKPWRFDDSRNAALALLPDDIDMCISLDMDEYLGEGWREEMEKAPKDATRIRYNYTWNFNPDGTPGLVFGGDKIHARHHYRWKHPVHEVITPDRITEVQYWSQLNLYHKADDTKSRGQYLPLLKLSVEEDPTDDRNAYYYARELFFHGRYKEANKAFKHHLSLKTAVWKPERAASMRYIAKTEEDNEQKLIWITNAVKECPGRRESLVELAQYYYDNLDWPNCLTAAKKALAIKERPMEYLCEDFAWGYLPHDLAAMGAYYTGKYEDALAYGRDALSIASEEHTSRLFENLKYYQEKYDLEKTKEES